MEPSPVIPRVQAVLPQRRVRQEESVEFRLGIDLVQVAFSRVPGWHEGRLEFTDGRLVGRGPSLGEVHEVLPRGLQTVHVLLRDAIDAELSAHHGTVREPEEDVLPIGTRRRGGELHLDEVDFHAGRFLPNLGGMEGVFPFLLDEIAEAEGFTHDGFYVEVFPMAVQREGYVRQIFRTWGRERLLKISGSRSSIFYGSQVGSFDADTSPGDVMDIRVCGQMDDKAWG